MASSSVKYAGGGGGGAATSYGTYGNGGTGGGGRGLLTLYVNLYLQLVMEQQI